MSVSWKYSDYRLFADLKTRIIDNKLSKHDSAKVRVANKYLKNNSNILVMCVYFDFAIMVCIYIKGSLPFSSSILDHAHPKFY